ncbi:response regulator transcription factor [Streptomyces sp. NPDC001770]
MAESDTTAADSLVRNLVRQGFAARSVTTGAKALQVHGDADLVLLDLDLPDLDGLEVCRSIRSVSEVPVIAVTARGTELDRVLGLQAGSDDYLVKPYGFRELVARMDAVMRRVRHRPDRLNVVVRGPLHMDAGTREARLGELPVSLTRKEFGLLHLLASQPDQVLSRRQIMARVWGDTSPQQLRTVDTHVSSVRGKLGSSDWIVTVRGIGFRIGHP